MKLKIINVGNGNKEYPGNFTLREIEIITRNMCRLTLHLFSGKSVLGGIRVDFKYGNIRMDVFEYLESFVNLNATTVIIDAPYNQRFADKYQKLGNTAKQFIIFANAKKTTELFKLIREKINPKIIIIKSWNYYIPKGYYLKKGYLCYAGGYRKPTILLIIYKKQT